MSEMSDDELDDVYEAEDQYPRASETDAWR